MSSNLRTVPRTTIGSQVPRPWLVVRLLSLTALLGACTLLILAPSTGLLLMARLLIPVLPLLFLVAPGLWRNVCPVATANQLPRVLGFTRGYEPPRWLRERGYLIGITLLAAIIPGRVLLFNSNGPAMAALLLGVTLLAFVGGLVFKGKSGWCSSICPMFPIERLYGQTPFLVVRNSHCEPCVGCAKNCYDADPLPAYRNDMLDGDTWWHAPRRVFASAFPGIIVAYFALPDAFAESAWTTYAGFLGFATVSSAILLTIGRATPEIRNIHPALFAALALNLFYWFGAPGFLATVGSEAHSDVLGVLWPFRMLLASLTLWWVVRTYHRDLAANGTGPLRATGAVPVTLSPRFAPSPPALTAGSVTVDDEVTFVDHDATVVAPGCSILDAAEQAGVPLSGACRSGMCGADPIAVIEGAEHLCPVGGEEAKTLQRLGLPAHARMACSARLTGTGGVCVSTNPDEPPRISHAPGGGAESGDPAVHSVVIVGNGVAGVTAAEEVRKLHPDCEIHLIGREPFPFYNRMEISRLIYDRNAMSGLSLRSDEWYQEQRITNWVNTQVRAINRGRRSVELATGEVIPWDRLILATGSRSTVPPIPGAGLPGVFVLRQASDALALRAYAQDRLAVRAAVIGGGLLGLEAAHALHRLGLDTTVLEGSPRLLPRMLDENGSAVLAGHFAREGVRVLTGVKVEAIVGHERVEALHLGAAGHMAADLVVVCAGITPNVELARNAGIAVNRGVLVDETMRTSAAGVFAIGDAAEVDGMVVGLWATASAQAEIAARNALGADEAFVAASPAAVLKGAGIELTSVGRITPQPDDELFSRTSPNGDGYWLVLIDRHGRLAGAVVVGLPGPARLAVTAMNGDRAPGPLLDALADRSVGWLTPRPGVPLPPPLPAVAG